MGTPFPAQEIANRMLTGFARVGNNQSVERLFTYNDDKRHTPSAACALGALALGLDQNQQATDYKNFWFEFDQYFPNVIVTDPVTKESYQIEDVIIQLNDRHGWTIPAIAKWISCLDTENLESCC